MNDERFREAPEWPQPEPVNKAWEMIIDGRRVVAIDTNRYSAREMTRRARQSWRNRMSRIRPLHRAAR